MAGLQVTRQGLETLGSLPRGVEVTRQGVEVLGSLDQGLQVTRQGIEVLGTSSIAHFKSATDTLTLDDTASASVAYVAAATSEIAVTDLAVDGIRRTVETDIDFVQEAEATIGVRTEVSATSALFLSQEAAGASSILTAAAESELSLTDAARSTTIFPSEESEISLEQTAAIVQAVERSASNALTFTETIIDPLSLEEIEVEHALDHEATAYVLSPQYGGSSIASFSQSVGLVVVRTSGASASVESVLSLSTAAVKSEQDDCESEIAVAQDASAVVGKPASNTLAISGSASFQIVREPGVETAISVTQAVSFRLERDTTHKTYSPFVGDSSDSSAPEPPSTTAPELLDVEGVVLYYPINSPTTQVALRGPDFGDRHLLQFNRIQRETRGGSLRIYADPNWPKIQRLRLSFRGLKEEEGQALLTFLQDTLGKKIGLRDWEGQRWDVCVVTPDEPLIRNARKNISVSLDLEGSPVTTYEVGNTLTLTQAVGLVASRSLPDVQQGIPIMQAATVAQVIHRSASSALSLETEADQIFDASDTLALLSEATVISTSYLLTGDGDVLTTGDGQPLVAE